MKRTCEISEKEFYVFPEDIAFYEKLSPQVGEKTLSLPPPRLSPDERQRRRLACRNERYLYKRRCALTNKEIVSAYSPDIPLKVCEKASWLKVDNTDFGREFDFYRPFFEQFSELFQDTYKCAVIHDGEMLNSEYTHFCGWLKNCYLVFDTGKSEDCIYGVLTVYCRDCVDGLYLSACELCYDSVKLENCYETFFSSYCVNCNSSAYLDSCIGCSNCLCSTNLRNKQYYAFNEHVGKERFTEIWNSFFNGSYSQQVHLRKRFADILLSSPRRATRIINCENVKGDDLTRCKDVFDSYNCTDCRDCRYCYDLTAQTNDCYDVATFGEGMQYCYELSACGGALGKSEVSNCYFSSYIFYGGYNILYSTNCHENSQNIFGCCDLRKKHYCILNKQYSKEDYEALVPRIVEHMTHTGEWGEFFPMSISPFGYNQSLAQEFYPLSEIEAKSLSAKWSKYQAPIPDAKGLLDSYSLPDSLYELSDEALNVAIRCDNTQKLFKLTERELSFYRKYGLPIPRLHPEERHRQRRASLNPRKLFKRNCDKTGAKILSSYAPDAPDTVYSDEAYLESV